MMFLLLKLLFLPIWLPLKIIAELIEHSGRRHHRRRRHRDLDDQLAYAFLRMVGIALVIAVMAVAWVLAAAVCLPVAGVAHLARRPDVAAGALGLLAWWGRSSDGTRRLPRPRVERIRSTRLPAPPSVTQGTAQLPECGGCGQPYEAHVSYGNRMVCPAGPGHS